MNILYTLFLILSFSSISNKCIVEVNTTVLRPSCPQIEEDELFKIKTLCELTYSKIAIYNKWNRIIYEVINSNNGFDGTYENMDLPDGIYDYVIDYKLDREDHTLQLKGQLRIER